MNAKRLIAWLGLALPLAWSCSGSDSAQAPDAPSGGAQSSAGDASTSGASGSPSAAGTMASGAGSSHAGANTNGGASGSGGANTSGGASSAGVPNDSHGGDGGDGGSAPHWQPRPGLTWQWQLSETVSSPVDVDVYDIDWESDASVVQDLHARGIRVICYVSVGSWEDFRPDADDFPTNVIGNDYDGWPGEKYVDLRSQALRQVMSRRFDICRQKGFDAIEPDNMDVFELGSDSGFPLSKADGIEFARWLADEAHARGMAIGQKNAASITPDIEPIFDWALTESCFSDGNWCGEVSDYVTANKPVFMCEYEPSSFDAACSAWKSKSYSPILKNLELDAQLTRCP